MKNILPIILITVILASTLCINASAALPSQDVTGYYPIWTGNDNQFNNANAINVFGSDSYVDYIAFLTSGTDFYFIDSVVSNDGARAVLNVSGTGSLSQITLDYMDSTDSIPLDVRIYWNSDAYVTLEAEADSIEELTYDVPSVDNPFVITSVLDVFIQVPGFLISALASLITIFYADGSLTVLGVLAIASLAFAVILLLWVIISRFLKFRG